MANRQLRDNSTRRDFLRAGALGIAGLSLASYLRMAAARDLDPKAPAKQAIFIHLVGGASHIDTFDMKPEAPVEYRGEFKPIKTNVPGVEICEHMPKLAQCMDKWTLIRNVTHTIAGHSLGSRYIHTGNRPVATVKYPSYGSVTAKETESINPIDLPAFVAIPSMLHNRPGLLGVKYAPLGTNARPAIGKPFRVRGIEQTGTMTSRQIADRQQLLRDTDVTFASIESSSQLVEGLDRFSRRAYQIMKSPRTNEALDISRESPAFAKPFGTTGFGATCLLATRLIEAGVRFVSFNLGGFDTHKNNFTDLRDKLLPPLDEGLSALCWGLEQKGLLDSTIVFVTGEFGRTPRVVGGGGRNHHPRCNTMLMTGGGVRGGHVIGESDEKAMLPKHESVSPDDVAASFYHALGIDHNKEYQSPAGRPVMIVRKGKVIKELFGSSYTLG